jgi:hypothetical protein
MAKRIPIVPVADVDGYRRPIRQLVSWWLSTHSKDETLVNGKLVIKVQCLFCACQIFDAF